MAIVAYTKVTLDANTQIPKGVQVVLWEGLETGDTATAYAAPQYSGKVIQMDADGTASVTVQGTLVPAGATIAAVWGDLHSVDLTTATTTDASPLQILEDCYQIRPTVTTGTDVDVYLMVTTSARG